MTIPSYDLLILGSGSTAFAAAIRAAELGQRAAMIEGRTIGGTCVNRGCLPSKNLIAAAQMVHDANHPRFPGLQPAPVGIDFATLIAQKDDLIEMYRTQHYDSILTDVPGRAPIDLFTGQARFVDAHTVAVTTSDGTEQQVAGAQILIATGSHPHIPAVSGLATVPFLTSDLLTRDEGLELREQPTSLLILGGGYIALELGQLFARLGTPVTILARSGILPGYEPEIRDALGTILRDEGITLIEGFTDLTVAGDAHAVRVQVTRDGQIMDYTAVKLLLATGRTPNTADLHLDAAGVAVNASGAVQVDATLRTNISHIWAAGDVIGTEVENQMATPVGAHDGKRAAENALTPTQQQVNHRVIPRVIFTDPQVAVVGFTDEDAAAQGIVCQCRTVPMSAVPRAGAVRDTRGAIKMVIDEQTERVLGVSMLGRDAGEVIHEAAMGLRFQATLDDFIDLIHVYPTMAEALKIVAIAFRKDYATLSCCAS